MKHTALISRLAATGKHWRRLAITLAWGQRRMVH